MRTSVHHNGTTGVCVFYVTAEVLCVMRSVWKTLICVCSICCRNCASVLVVNDWCACSFATIAGTVCTPFVAMGTAMYVFYLLWMLLLSVCP